jgi:hypothetical protein
MEKIALYGNAAAGDPPRWSALPVRRSGYQRLKELL